MKTRIRIWAVIGLLACWAGSAIAADTLSVQADAVKVRSSATPFGPIVASLTYGDQVTKIAEQGAWTQITTAGGASGWVQSASLSTKKITLKAGSTDVSKTASGEELALAGKGFNSKVEGEFKANNPKIDFKWIDSMEKLKVSEKEMVAFLREGGLSAGGSK